MSARRNLAVPVAEFAFVLTLFLLPWIGVGLGNLLVGRSLGTGAQPALISGAVVVLCLPFFGQRNIDRDGERVLVVLGWTLLGTAAVWGFDEMGLAGDAPWTKVLKQMVQLAYFFALAAAPTLLLGRVRDGRVSLRRWESAASAGMLLASIAGLYLAAAFYLNLPGKDALWRIFSSNPSIAAGSDELYLGHSFVGIPRVRSGAAEPLYFGSYLLCVLPVTAMGWIHARRWGRVWRMAALVLGFSCAALTFSRGVYLGLSLLVVLLLLGARSGVLPRAGGRKVIWGAVGAFVGVLVLAAVFTGMAPWQVPALMLRRMEQSFASHDLSNLTRLASWRAAWLLFVHHPLQGIGWGAFGFWFYRVGGPAAGSAVFGWPVTNSFPLRVLAETGAVGAVLWGLLLWSPLRPLRALRRRTTPQGSMASVAGGDSPSPTAAAVVSSPTAPTALSSRVTPAAFVLASSVAAMLLQLTTFSQLNLPHLWLCAGVAVAVARRPGVI